MKIIKTLLISFNIFYMWCSFNIIETSMFLLKLIIDN